MANSSTTVPCAACGKPAKKSETFLYTRGRKDEECVPLCDGCWNDGPNNEAWDDKIQQRIADRRAKKKSKPPKLFSVLVTVKTTISVRNVEAEDELAAERKVCDMDVAELERIGDEVDTCVDLDSVERQSFELTKSKVRRG